MTSPETLDRLSAMLNRFISGEDRSLNYAGELEGAIAAAFPDDERFEDCLAALASYSPGGGAFLYDEQAMVARCRSVLLEIESMRRKD